MIDVLSQDTLTLSAKDLKSGLEVKWCAGCGDHAILNCLQNALPKLGHKHEDIVIVSGIGCSSRFPYYMNTYGMHTIHGRASAIASGVKLANSKLHVWQITGDGDALAIGGNHFIHTVRRNIDINVILFNNEIYGLTKGQYSPTTKKGHITKTSPQGTIETPFNPGELVIGSKGKFFARSVDNNLAITTDILVEAGSFKGTSIVEILQNCVIFNQGTHAMVTDKDVKDDRQVILKQGQPMLFGKNKEKGLVLRGFELEVVTIGENGITEKDILVHDAKMVNPSLHLMLINMKAPEFPVAIGVIRSVDDTTYDAELEQQITDVKAKSKIKSVDDLFYAGDIWEVK
jgi:2-oxoglutarate/2-oxoacid ferredoxin oxidoreductase subunit beta